MDRYTEILGREVEVVVDRPLGSFHPDHPGLFYPVNYGYVPGVAGGDGEEQDVYLLGVDAPVKRCRAVVIAVLHRLDDVEDKWVAAPAGMSFSREEIRSLTRFQEQYFETELLMNPL